MKRTTLFSWIVLSLSILTWSCSTSTQENKEESIQERVDKAEDNFEQERRKLKNDLEELRADIDAKIDKIDRELDKAGTNAKNKLRETREELSAQRREVNTLLDRIGKSTEQTWKEVKVESRRSFDKLRNSFNEAKENIKELFD